MPVTRLTGCTLRLRVSVSLLFPTDGISGCQRVRRRQREAPADAIVEATRVTGRTRRLVHLRVPALGPEGEQAFQKHEEKAEGRLEATERLGKLSIGT